MAEREFPADNACPQSGAVRGNSIFMVYRRAPGSTWSIGRPLLRDGIFRERPPVLGYVVRRIGNRGRYSDRVRCPAPGTRRLGNISLCPSGRVRDDKCLYGQNGMRLYDFNFHNSNLHRPCAAVARVSGSFVGAPVALWQLLHPLELRCLPVLGISDQRLAPCS